MTVGKYMDLLDAVIRSTDALLSASDGPHVPYKTHEALEISQADCQTMRNYLDRIGAAPSRNLEEILPDSYTKNLIQLEDRQSQRPWQSSEK